VAILGWDNPGAAALRDRSPGRVIGFSARETVPDGAFLDGNILKVTGIASPDGEPWPIVHRDEIPLRGAHNVLNVLAACAIAGAATVQPEAMRAAILDFQGVPHRLEIVRRQNGVTWVNDSIATAPERVLAALHSYEEPLILLLGGRDKKLPWEALAALAVRKARAVVTFGEHGPAIAETLGQALDGPQETALTAANIRTVATLDEGVPLAAELVQPGDVVLLSPGGTSYDAYRDFEERGAHFRALVNAL
jgi:UDP-N-acetylmuramoylalanine--D-glutamate ligase